MRERPGSGRAGDYFMRLIRAGCGDSYEKDGERTRGRNTGTGRRGRVPGSLCRRVNGPWKEAGICNHDPHRWNRQKDAPVSGRKRECEKPV